MDDRPEPLSLPFTATELAERYEFCWSAEDGVGIDPVAGHAAIERGEVWVDVTLTGEDLLDECIHTLMVAPGPWQRRKWMTMAQMFGTQQDEFPSDERVAVAEAFDEIESLGLPEGTWIVTWLSSESDESQERRFDVGSRSEDGEL